MESELSPDKEKDLPPRPLKTYQWEDLRRAREAGGYPWTHLNKSPLEGEITAEDIIRATTPRRSMSREVSKSRTHSPDERDVQKILNLNSSPGSSRKHNEDGKDEGVHVPNFSKEISLDSEDDIAKGSNGNSIVQKSETQNNAYLASPIEKPKNVSPKGILKRRVPEEQYIGTTETREKTKCCHPLVNKIKHLADKTLHKLDKNDNEKSPISKRKKNEEIQEIRQLRNSPGAVRRQKFSVIKLGSSDEMSKTMSIDTPPLKMRKEHIYEDIEEFSPDIDMAYLPEKKIIKDDYMENTERENDNIFEKKSIASQDPSLIIEDNNSLTKNEHIMEHLHKIDDINNEGVLIDEEKDPDEPNVDEIFQNQFEETRAVNDSPNIMITEIVDEENTNYIEQSTTIPIETSPSPSPRENGRKINGDEFFDRDWSKSGRYNNIIKTLVMSKLRRWTSEGGTPLEKTVRPTREGSVQLYTPEVRCACQFFQCDSLLPERITPAGTRPTSRASNMISNVSDHEYEIIEKPLPNIIYTTPSVDDQTPIIKKDDELSSTTSLERKCLQHITDDEDHEDIKETSDEKDENILNAEAIQKDIEDRFFANTPSTLSRTECEISTSQVDSSALENLPLKRENRKNEESLDSKIQQRFKEGTGKLRAQAGKLRTKLHNLRTKQFSLPERPKVSSDQPKAKIPEKRKFSLPDRPKFKKINLSEKLSLGDRKKFSLPERPRFTVPDLPKFKMPERPKLSFPSLGRKKNKTGNKLSESSTDLQNVATVDFETKTYPRIFNKIKKSQITKTSSSPVLNREDTPPPTFEFTRMKNKTSNDSQKYIPDSPEYPREYGAVDNETSFEGEAGEKKEFDTTYDFDNVDPKYFVKDTDQSDLNNTRNAFSISNISPSIQENTHINELNNDEFFVRPRGISRENIQVREYLSDEIRQAFNIPKNVLAVMGSDTGIECEKMYANEIEADRELTLDDNDHMRYSSEDINDRDDGYYTFPPIRPSRAKRKKKDLESIRYVDESVNASMQFSEVDLGISEDNLDEIQNGNVITDDNKPVREIDYRPSTDLHSIHEYSNDDIIEYPNNIPIQSQTLPMPPKRKKKYSDDDLRHSSYNDFKNFSPSNKWQAHQQSEDVIVYRTEHEYVVPYGESAMTEQSPVPPRRTRSRSSRCTSICDDDRTSHGAESLTLDSHIPPADEFEDKVLRQESPGYATVDKGSHISNKISTRAKSKTPPVRRRRSNSSDRKYYTVTSKKTALPNRPPRKKSSSSLMTLDSFTKQSMNGDYDEIEDQKFEIVHKDLKSGNVLSKMKDRPLPPPPRPPRGPRRSKDFVDNTTEINYNALQKQTSNDDYTKEIDPVEIEVSTQTDPLPDDVDFELGIDDNFDISMSSSLRDIIDEESIIGKNVRKPISRPGSRSEKSFKFSDPKLSELSKSNIGRTSPTVILVEKRVSSPTRINEREEILTEASLTVKHIDIDESKIPDVPPLPRSKTNYVAATSSKPTHGKQENTFETFPDSNREMKIDNLVTQNLKVKDLDVGRLNVSELQASKILVSEIEGMTLNVQELESKSGHIAVNGIEFSQTVIDEIVKKFAEISTSQISTQIAPTIDIIRPVSREEETQTELSEIKSEEIDELPPPPPPPLPINDSTLIPQRPPPPDLGPLLLSYLQDMTPSIHHAPRSSRERPNTEFFDTQFQSPHPPIRRSKRKLPIPHTESSSDDEKPRPSPRRLPAVRAHEPTITEAGAQFFRVCQSSISRSIRNIFNMFTSYIHRTEDKKDVQMAMVIFLVLIAGLIMLGLSDSRTIHHHHWEFFNPPDTNK